MKYLWHKAEHEVPGPNGKPFRSKAQKAMARKLAYKDMDGAWRSSAPFSFHGVMGEFVWNERGIAVRIK